MQHWVLMRHWQVIFVGILEVAFVCLLVLSLTLALACGPSEEKVARHQVKEQCKREQAFSACTSYCGSKPKLSSYNRFDGIRCDCDGADSEYFDWGIRIRNFTWTDCAAEVEKKDRIDRVTIQ